MKLSLDIGDGNYVITGYEPGVVYINAIAYRQNLLVTPENLYTEWSLGPLANLQASAFDCLRPQLPDVLLLGTGARLRWPDRQLLPSLRDAGIGLEVMDTAAACRTYNILMAEGRTVAAGLILEDA